VFLSILTMTSFTVLPVSRVVRGLPSDYSGETKHDTVYHFWFSVLDEINAQHRLGLDLKRDFGVKLPRNITVLQGYNDAFKQKRVDGYTSIID
jgi:hypothetical protein